MWNDILTVIVTIFSLVFDVATICLIYILYKKNRAMTNRVNDHVRLLKMIRGEIKREELDPFCDALTEIEKKILFMYFCDNMKIEAIAVELNMSFDYVKKVKGIAVAKLKQEM